MRIKLNRENTETDDRLCMFVHLVICTALKLIYAHRVRFYDAVIHPKNLLMNKSYFPVEIASKAKPIHIFGTLYNKYWLNIHITLHHVCKNINFDLFAYIFVLLLFRVSLPYFDSVSVVIPAGVKL